MKQCVLILLSCLCFSANGQGILKKMSVGFRAGAIFANYDNDYETKIARYRYDSRNHWHFEMSVEDKKFGIGINARIITEIRGFIKNPIAQTPIYIDRQNLQIGDLLSVGQNLAGFTFFVNKRILLLGEKHRFDFGVGTQKRIGQSSYYVGKCFWECSSDTKPLDKHGLFTRLGYSYLINKHFSVSTNIEYARFQKRPTDLFFVNVLAGVRF